MSTTIIFKARANFVSLFEARENPFNSKRNYEVTAMFPKDSEAHKTILKAMQEAAKQKWGEKAESIYKKALGSTNTRMIQEDEKTGLMRIVCRRKETDGMPAVVDGRLQNIAPNAGKPRSGDECAFRVSVYAYDQNGSKGFTNTLLGVQFIKEGEPFGGAPVASAEGFEKIEGEDEEDNPFA